MAEANEDSSPTAAGHKIDDVEISRNILEIVTHLTRLAAQASDEQLARDLRGVLTRAEKRIERELN